MKYEYINIIKFRNVSPELIEKIMLSIRNGDEAETPYDPKKGIGFTSEKGVSIRHIESDKPLLTALRRVRKEFNGVEIALNGFNHFRKGQDYSIGFDEPSP